MRGKLIVAALVSMGAVATTALAASQPEASSMAQSGVIDAANHLLGEKSPSGEDLRSLLFLGIALTSLCAAGVVFGSEAVPALLVGLGLVLFLLTVISPANYRLVGLIVLTAALTVGVALQPRRSS